MIFPKGTPREEKAKEAEEYAAKLQAQKLSLQQQKISLVDNVTDLENMVKFQAKIIDARSALDKLNTKYGNEG